MTKAQLLEGTGVKYTGTDLKHDVLCKNHRKWVMLFQSQQVGVQPTHQVIFSWSVCTRGLEKGKQESLVWRYHGSYEKFDWLRNIGANGVPF